MYFFEDIIAAEAKKAGIRAVIGESLIDFPTPSFHTLDEGIARCESLVQQWYGNDLIHPTVCAHSPYTCSKQTLRKAKDIPEKYNIPLHIHVAETRKEVEDVTAQTGASPAEYLYSIGLLDRNVIAAHSVWLNPKDIELYARTHTSVAHCPKSNLKLASGIADTDAYLKREYRDRWHGKQQHAGHGRRNTLRRPSPQGNTLQPGSGQRPHRPSHGNHQRG